jgi:hypothetical protein
MARARSVSLQSFHSAVESAVKAAVERHPRFRVDVGEGITTGYLIWGIPVPESIAGGASIKETQEFANAVATGLGRAVTEIGGTAEGAFLSRGGYLILGIPVPPEVLIINK